MRFALTTLGTLVLASLVMPLNAISRGADGAASQPATQSARELSADQLIDRLTDITNNEFSVRTNIFAGDALPQGLLYMQDAKLAPSAAMDELVRRGLDALPALLAHLDDARKTKSTIRGMMSGISYSANFDQNRRTATTQPAGVSDGRDFGRQIPGAPRGNEYTVAVGDLCFNIIGAIVNRRYESVAYRPTAIVIVNSPVLSPELRDAVRKQWSGISAEQLRDSLTADILMPDDSGRDTDAIHILWRYYPQAAVSVVEKRLKIPFYDSFDVKDFAEEKLYVAVDARERKKLIDEFIAKNGPAARDGLLIRLWEDRRINHSTANTQYRTVPVAPSQIYAELVPDRDPELFPQVSATEWQGLNNFILALADMASPQITQMVWAKFKQYSARHERASSPGDDIAEACAKSLIHRGHDAELLAYCLRQEEYGQDMSELVRLLIQSRPAKSN